MAIERLNGWCRVPCPGVAVIVLLVLVACGGGGGSSPPSTATAPGVEPEATGTAENDGETDASAHLNVSESYGWQEDEVHATLIPTFPYGERDARFPPGVRYGLYVNVDNSDDRAPVMEFGPIVHVGADVAPAREALDGTGSRGGAELSVGEVRDGIGAADVLAYLRTIAGGNLEGGLAGLQKWTSAPRVQIVGEADGRFIRLTRDAGQIMNAALPFTERLKLQVIDTPVDEERAESFYRSGFGEIFVRFVPKSNSWWSGADGDELGRTRVLKHVYYNEQEQRRQVGFGHGIVRADVLIDPDAVASLDDGQITYLLVHELLHAMGFMSHTDPERFRSTLNEVYVPGTEPRSLIHRIDREGLLAAYSRFKAGTPPELMTYESLGPWSDTSRHARGDLALPSGGVAFGVAFGNGLPQPWAFGPPPTADLADNAGLSGTVTWSGALVGMTPAGKTVVGGSLLSVDLSKVRHPAYLTEPDGMLRFTGMRFDDGSSWGDGDLGYSIEVNGNEFDRARSSFIRYGPPNGEPYYGASGEDFGVVTGVFFGKEQEGMGGVLERHDLSAAFGGRR